jgi:hypothetical protein
MSFGTPAARKTAASRTLSIVAAIAVDARGLSIVHLRLATATAAATDVASLRRLQKGYAFNIDPPMGQSRKMRLIARGR